MATVLNTMYPPQVNTIMPAFVASFEEPIIYFSLSPYNDKSSIKKLHISVIDAKTNTSVISNNTGVYITDFDLYDNYDNIKKSYFVKIPFNAINGNYNINQYYKVQIRIDIAGSDAYDNTNALQQYSYLTDNIDYFTEWSSVCLIKPISNIVINIKNFSNANVFNSGTMHLIGSVSFEDANDTETLQRYSVQILDNSYQVVLDTDYFVSTNTINSGEINCVIDTSNIDLSENNNFICRINIETINQYITHKDYNFQIVDFYLDNSFYPTIASQIDNDNGIIKIIINNDDSVSGILYVKRSSIKSNYTNWENIYITGVNGEIDNLTITDNTIDSLVPYKYSVQLENKDGISSRRFISNIVICDYEDAFLSRGNVQFAMRFNFNISNFTTALNRQKVDTIGGKYPKFVENDINYKQISINGMISSEEDADYKFISKAEYNKYLTDYQVGSPKINDVVWEKIFRDAIYKWMNDGKAKLFRSQTEGVFCVMLNNVSITPEQALGRRLWNFSADAYEVGDGNSLSVINNLGIYDIMSKNADGGDVGGSTSQSDIDNVISEYGIENRKVIRQLYMHNITTFDDIVNTVIEPYEQKISGLSSNQVSDFCISNVNISFENEAPHQYAVITDLETGEVTYDRIPSTGMILTDGVQYSGYRFSVDNPENVIYTKGEYQFPIDTKINKLYFQDYADPLHQYYDSQTTEYVTIDYVANYEKPIDTSGNTLVRINQKNVGQISGLFKNNDSIYNKLVDKYSLTYYDGKNSKYKIMLNRIYGLSFDMISSSISHFGIKYNGDDQYTEISIPTNGFLDLGDNLNIVDFCCTDVNGSEGYIQYIYDTIVVDAN